MKQFLNHSSESKNAPSEINSQLIVQIMPALHSPINYLVYHQSPFNKILPWAIFMLLNLRVGLVWQLRVHELLVLFITILSCI